MNLKNRIKARMIVQIDPSKVMEDGFMIMDWCYLHDAASSNCKRYVIRHKLWLSEIQEAIDKIAELIEEDERKRAE